MLVLASSRQVGVVSYTYVHLTTYLYLLVERSAQRVMTEPSASANKLCYTQLLSTVGTVCSPIDATRDDRRYVPTYAT